MTVRMLLSLGAVVSLAAGGCDDAFSPKGPIAESPILYCVIEVRPAQEYYTVTATLTRVYDVEGFNPLVNAEDPTIGRASISLVAGRSLYSLEETLIPRPIASPYGECWHVYRATQAYIRTRDTLRLSARLPDGGELSAMTVVPSFKPFSTFPLYLRGVTTRLPSLYYGSAWIINWDDFAHDDHLFFPRLQLIWEVTSDSGIVSEGRRDVPLRYVPHGTGVLPVYPKVTTARELAFDFAAIDATMAAISEGDPDKSRYRVRTFQFDLIELDFPLSRYYSSINGSLDQLSIRLEESVFTNVTNGYGIFGTSMVNSRAFSVDRTYAAEFGYSAGLLKAAPP